MSATIRDQVLGYANIEKFFKTNTSAITPYTIKDMVHILGDSITGFQQLNDYVKKNYFSLKKLSRIREGKSYKYWWNDNEYVNKSEPKPETGPILFSETLNPEERNELNDLLSVTKEEIPEIFVNSKENRVSIKTPSCKITIEY